MQKFSVTHHPFLKRVASPQLSLNAFFCYMQARLLVDQSGLKGEEMYSRQDAKLLLVAVITIAAVLASGACADDVYVSTTGNDTTGDGTTTKPWKTITHALGEVTGTSTNPVTIHVAAGTYSSTATCETYPLNMEDYVSLSGEHQDATILDAENDAYHVIYSDGVNDLTVEKLTITGGHSTGDWDHGGPGVSCRYSSPNILNNRITHNTTSSGPGGGIACYHSSPLISSNIISYNDAAWGGEIFCSYSSPQITDNVISHNTRSSGGGIYCHGSSPYIFNNIITHNDASNGNGSGGIDCLSSSPDIINNTITFNSGPWGGGVSTWLGGCSPTVKNCILWGNGDDLYQGSDSHLSATYCCIEDHDAGEGNIHDYPQFCSRGGDTDFDGYFLKQEKDGRSWPSSEWSPCIDAGDPSDNPFCDPTNTKYSTAVNGFLDMNTVDIGYHYKRHGITAIDLVSFTAHEEASSMIISWETGAEIDNAGFVLFRNVAGTTEYKQISGMVEARGTAASGGSYRFVDDTVRRGILYEYWLVDIETSGKWTGHGPVTAKLPSALELTELLVLNHPVSRR